MNEDSCKDRPWATAQTIAIIKPDAVRRRLVADVLGYVYNFTDLEVLRMRQLEPDVLLPGPGRWNPRKFYGKQHEGREYFEDLVTFMCQGPSIAMLLKSGPPQGDAIGKWRELMGPWKDRVEGTIRGDLMLPSSRPMENLVHGSDSLDSFVWEYGCLKDVL